MEKIYTVPELAELLSVTRAAVYKWMKLGMLEYVTLGADRRVTQSALDAFLHRNNHKESGGTTANQDQPMNHKGGQLEYTPA